VPDGTKRSALTRAGPVHLVRLAAHKTKPAWQVVRAVIETVPAAYGLTRDVQGTQQPQTPEQPRPGLQGRV